MFLRNKKKHTVQQKNKIEQLENEIDRLNELLSCSEKDINQDLNIIRQVFDISGLGYWTKSLHEPLLTLSKKAQEILNIKDKNTITCEQFLDCVHPDDVSLVESQINSLAKDTRSVEIEYRLLIIENDTREIRYCSTKAIRTIKPDVNQSIIIGIIYNNIDIEKTRREVSKAIERAEEAERSKNTMLSNISHEIRTPMNAIIGFSELLNIGNLDFEKRKDYVKTIRNQGILLLKFIDDITELIKFESGNVKIAKTKCDLNMLLKEIQVNANQQKKALNKEALEIKLMTPDKKNLIIYTDSGRLQQVISNLINNSIKFTEKGYIEFGHKMPSEGKIEFYVKDTGIGLSKEQQKNIFNRFAEEEIVKRKYEGSGLGLTLCKHLIKLLGGKIWVESESGKGAVFQFTIQHEETPRDFHDYSSVEEEHLPSYKWKDKVILIVEDDEVNFRFLEAILHESDVQILHAVNGFQAVELCKTINKIDLILMDIKMPEMNGFEATRLIREFNKKIPIIAQTAFILEIDMDKCFSLGCNECITKPIDIKEFLEKVNDFLKE
ncbi:MAG: response regulator [Bacteroidales bacterium]|nr:response regulator [Bacteroidales bacterium]